MATGTVRTRTQRVAVQFDAADLFRPHQANSEERRLQWLADLDEAERRGGEPFFLNMGDIARQRVENRKP